MINLCDAVLHATQGYQEAANRKRLEIRTIVPPEPVTVCADHAAIRQVLDNLLSNAVKFSPPGKQITATLRVMDQTVECTVQDQGPGFTADDKARMFSRYGRLSARPTAGEPSTGLGLSIVKKLVQAMGAELICESEAGQGAAFTVRFTRPAVSG